MKSFYSNSKYQILFTKLVMAQKLIVKFFWLKLLLIVYTQSFQIREYVIFYNKIIESPYAF